MRQSWEETHSLDRDTKRRLTTKEMRNHLQNLLLADNFEAPDSIQAQKIIKKASWKGDDKIEAVKLISKIEYRKKLANALAGHLIMGKFPAKGSVKHNEAEGLWKKPVKEWSTNDDSHAEDFIRWVESQPKNKFSN